MSIFHYNINNFLNITPFFNDKMNNTQSFKNTANEN